MSDTPAEAEPTEPAPPDPPPPARVAGPVLAGIIALGLLAGVNGRISTNSSRLSPGKRMIT